MTAWPETEARPGRHNTKGVGRHRGGGPWSSRTTGKMSIRRGGSPDQVRDRLQGGGGRAVSDAGLQVSGRTCGAGAGVRASWWDGERPSVFAPAVGAGPVVLDAACPAVGGVRRTRRRPWWSRVPRAADAGTRRRGLTGVEGLAVSDEVRSAWTRPDGRRLRRISRRPSGLRGDVVPGGNLARSPRPAWGRELRRARAGRFWAKGNPAVLPGRGSDSIAGSSGTSTRAREPLHTPAVVTRITITRDVPRG